MIRLVTGIATKARLSGNMFPNLKTCENGLSNFSENMTIVAIKLLELTRIHKIDKFIVIYFNFVGFWGPL